MVAGGAMPVVLLLRPLCREPYRFCNNRYIKTLAEFAASVIVFPFAFCEARELLRRLILAEFVSLILAQVEGFILRILVLALDQGCGVGTQRALFRNHPDRLRARRWVA